ncbi:MAG: C39 family peptidase, partial [Rhodocyclaceae bacterium]|nr:C39 family peptidase [Rhodocyclaceae bacterium]
MPADTDSDALLMEAERLCNLGLALHALPMLEPLQRHASVRGPLLAARITTHLGGARAADATVLRLWRSQPRHAALTVQYLRVLNGRRGPYVAWRAMQELGLDGAAEARDRADWHALRASLLADFRDFEGAGAALDAAREAAPDDPWQLVERATVCAAADRYDEAMAAAEQALGMRPGYRPALQSLAHLLSLCGRDGEALDLLRAADSAAQSGPLCAQLYALQFEQGLYADAWASLQRCDYLYPLADRTLKNWLAAQRALTAQRLDMPDAARSAALQAGDDFHRRLAERLAAPDARDRRVLLPVGFVRQHYMTCAPATLAAISGYWGHAASHLEIAEQICYDGTFHHSERHWAESQGFLVREFTVDWDIARALLDAGIPFTLTTTWPGGAHLQAAIGYDELRGTLLIRDPMSRVHGEFAIDGLLAAHRSTGPRGLAFVPPAAAARMAGLHFPDAEIWDIQYAVNAALNRHQRDAAAQAAEQLAARFAGHRLAQVARRTLAAYDGDEAAMLAAVEQLLAMFPDDVNLQLAKAASLAALASRDKQLAWLAGLSCAPDGRPLVDLNHARLLGQDARQAARARTLLRRVLGRLPANAAAWSALADLLWQAGHKDAAIEHYRHAACLAETDEDHAATYFRANQFCGRPEAGLEFLRRRASRLGSRAGAPYMTLFNQLETLERTPEGFELLQQALARRGDDPALLLFAAEVHLRYRKLDAAQELAARVRLPTRRAEWLKLASQLAREQGDPARALELAREAAGLEPFNLGLQRLVASLYTVLEGPARALAYLRELADRFSHHSGLQMLLVDAMAGLPLADIEVILRRLLAINSSSVWAQRELATNLARQQRHAEAMQVMDAVMHLAADQSSTHAIKAFLLLQQGKPDAAKLSLRTALQLYIDNDYALNTLIDLCADLAERREALDFVYRELVRQVTCGDGLLNFREAAQRTLPPPDVLAVLREAHVARPDLWQAWVALGGQLSHMGHSAEALDLLGRAIEKFPLLPAVYCERALAYALRGRREEARADCRLALQINPQWTRAANLYVETVLDEGVSFDRAITVLDAALARNPEDAELRATRASTLWRDGQRPQAVAEMRAALLRAPKL